MKLPDQKVAVITGGSSGIGKAIALSLAEEGYHLAICARGEEKLDSLREVINLRFPETKISTFKCDLSLETEVKRFAIQVHEVFQKIDVLINNVGTFQPGLILKESDDFLENQLRINLFPAYYLSKFFGNEMVERKKGHIINIASIAGKQPVLGAGSYSISKFALLGLSRNLRLELKPSGVRVTSILPGATLTASWDGIPTNPDTMILSEDIAKIVVNCLNMSKGANMEEIEILPLT